MSAMPPRLPAAIAFALLLPDSLAQGFDGLRVYRLGDTPQQASHRIFAALRQLDRDGVEIAFCQTFDTAGIGWR